MQAVSDLFCDNCVEYEVFVRSVHQTVGMTCRTVNAVSGLHCLAGFLNTAFSRNSLIDGAASAYDEYHLAAVIVCMNSYGSSRHKASFEDTVGAVKKHVCCQFLLSTLELRHMRNLYFIKFQNHISIILFLGKSNKFPLTDKLAQRKIPVDLQFLHHRHKACEAALGLSCAACFEQLASVLPAALPRRNSQVINNQYII